MANLRYSKRFSQTLNVAPQPQDYLAASKVYAQIKAIQGKLRGRTRAISTMSRKISILLKTSSANSGIFVGNISFNHRFTRVAVGPRMLFLGDDRGLLDGGP